MARPRRDPTIILTITVIVRSPANPSSNLRSIFRVLTRKGVGVAITSCALSAIIPRAQRRFDFEISVEGGERRLFPAARATLPGSAGRCTRRDSAAAGSQAVRGPPRPAGRWLTARARPPDSRRQSLHRAIRHRRQRPSRPGPPGSRQQRGNAVDTGRGVGAVAATVPALVLSAVLALALSAATSATAGRPSAVDGRPPSTRSSNMTSPPLF